jgi:hypothetical protein
MTLENARAVAAKDGSGRVTTRSVFSHEDRPV